MKTFIFLFLFVSFSIAHSQSLRLTHPNGGEKFLRGSDILIQWEGSQSSDLIQLEYTTNNGTDWNFVDTTRGTSYVWKNVSIDTTFKYMIQVKTVISADDDKVELINTFNGHQNIVLMNMFTPDGKSIVSKDYAGNIKVWDVTKNIEHLSVKSNMYFSRALDISSDGKYFTSVTNDNFIKIWDLKSGQVIDSLRYDDFTIRIVKFCPKTNKLITGDRHGFIKIWDPFGNKDTSNFIRLPEETEGISISPNGETMLTLSNDSYVRFYNVQTKELLHSYKDFICYHRPAFSKNGKHLAIPGFNNFFLLNTELWKFEKGFAGHSSLVYECVFSPDERTMVSISQDRSMRIWDVETEEQLEIVDHFSEALSGVSFSSDGTSIASCGHDSTVRIWKYDRKFSQKDQSDSSFSIFEEITSVNNLIAKEEIITVTQNQNSSTIEICMNLTENGISTLKIFNANGMLIETKELSSFGSQTIQITTDSYSSGTYYITLTTPTRTETASFVLVK